MPMDFLKRIENSSFPLAIEDETDIHCVAVLVAAELVEAHLPPVLAGANRSYGVTILRITPMGRSELRRLQAKP
jgi:hypothetical protein